MKGMTTQKGHYIREYNRKQTPQKAIPHFGEGGTTQKRHHRGDNRQGRQQTGEITEDTTKGTPQGGQTGGTTACKAHHSRYHRGYNRIKETTTHTKVQFIFKY